MSIEIKTTNRKVKTNSSVTNHLKSFNIFGSSVGFQIDGKSDFKTCSGSLLTLLIFALVLTYGINKWNKFQEKSET